MSPPTAPARRPLLAAAFLFAVLVGAAPAAAQEADGLGGRISAHAFGEVEPGETVLIDVLDDTDLNLRMRDAIAEALRQRGWRPADRGRYTLLFQTQEIHSLNGDGGIGELSVSTGEGIRMHMNLWSATRDSLLANRSQSGRDSVNLLRLDMTLRDGADADKVVWQGQSFAEGRGVDRFAVFRQVAPHLLDRLGRSSSIETVEIE